MSWLRAALSAGLLVGGFQSTTIAAVSAKPAARAPTHVRRLADRSTAKPPPGRPIQIVRRSPFGLSIEYPLMEKALGTSPCPNGALVTSLRALGSPALRIGGDSQDLAGPTAAYHYAIPPSFWTTLGCLARETGAPITVGLNFAEGPLADELTTIAAAERAIPPEQLSFSLGNEPDLYGFSHILPNEPGFLVPAYRASPWLAGEYANEWATRRMQLGNIPIEGPDLAGIGWSARISQLLTSDPPDAMTVHAYPTVACGSAGAPTTVKRLLTKHASVGLVEKYRWLLAVARTAHRPAIISESNSGSCGGKPGVSDRPVAGVWAARYVVAALLEGFAQVRFHAAGTSYDPLSFGADGSVAIRPLGHALLFLHRWISLGSQISSGSSDPQILAARIAHGDHASMIVSSFSSKPLHFTIHARPSDGRLVTDTLTLASSIETTGSVAVRAHRAQLVLEPNTVVAIGTG
jgi:hypothetical protein